MAPPSRDYHGFPLQPGDRVEAYRDGIPYTAVITGIEPPHPGCDNHQHITLRTPDGTEIRSTTDAVIHQKRGTP